MSSFARGYLECPNCGSTDLDEIGDDKHKCRYCGTVTKPPTVPQEWYVPTFVKCPRCGYENDRGARYCSECGAVLARYTPSPGSGPVKLDPALISMLVTFGGTMFFPFGAVFGLWLAYRALRNARDSGETSGSEKMAKAAVVAGWIGLAMHVIPLCGFLSISAAQANLTICSELAR